MLSVVLLIKLEKLQLLLLHIIGSEATVNVCGRLLDKIGINLLEWMRCNDGYFDRGYAACRTGTTVGFVATVCPDGTPNLSPKGTTTVWDDDHLIFADIYSPGTVANLRQNPSVEINVVDADVRKGYRFKGTATILTTGEVFDTFVAFYRDRGTLYPIQSIVLVKVERALAVISPAYDSGASEAEIRTKWQSYRESLRSQGDM
jgi:predicted pyridoxine 5'-phosphate oxidase superfamily flavin-nucleotide-binding protein